jgi:hypothetical protein
MSPPPDIDSLSPFEVKSLLLELLQERKEFQRTIAALRDEIVRLKGGPGWPDIKANVKNLKPSGMERASEARPADTRDGRRKRGGVRSSRASPGRRGLDRPYS